jgi:hypothetical protein
MNKCALTLICGTLWMATLFRETARAGEEKILIIQGEPLSHVITSSNATVKLPASDKLGSLISQMTDGAVAGNLAARLEVQGVCAPTNPATAVRVFINKPADDTDNSPSSLYYVGSFTFAGGPAKNADGETFYLDPLPALRRLRKSNTTNITATNITLTAVPLHGRLDEGGILFSNASFSIIKREP